MVNFWFAGRTEENGWHILGLFDSEKLAVGRCRELRDFVAPIKLNEKLPEEATDWPGCYFPLIKDRTLFPNTPHI